MMMSLFCSGVVVYLVSYELGFQKYIQGRQNRFFQVKHKSIFVFIQPISLKFLLSKYLVFGEAVASPVPTPLNTYIEYLTAAYAVQLRIAKKNMLSRQDQNFQTMFKYCFLMCEEMKRFLVFQRNIFSRNFSGAAFFLKHFHVILKN